MKGLEKFLQELRNVTYEVQVRISCIKKSVYYDVPYVSQFAKPEHAELSLKKTLHPSNDPHWRDSGAESQERYTAWAFAMCGMASTVMALEHFTNIKVRPVVLAEDALSAGVYDEDQDNISGMKYKEFATWIRKHGLYASVYSRLSVRGIQFALARGKLVIVSVNPNIRGYETAPADQKGGHLVLVTGYDIEKRTISINNPSGFASTNTQINHEIPLENFRAFYAGRGIVISKET